MIQCLVNLNEMGKIIYLSDALEAHLLDIFLYSYLSIEIILI